MADPSADDPRADDPNGPAPSSTSRLRLTDPDVRTFGQLLVNVLAVSVINFTVWFAITFFVYLETGRCSPPG